ncbi:hypothetical protein, partial [Yersinia pestis]
KLNITARIITNSDCCRGVLMTLVFIKILIEIMFVINDWSYKLDRGRYCGEINLHIRMCGF